MGNIVSIKLSSSVNPKEFTFVSKKFYLFDESPFV
jgi:hypothetical protein